MKATALVAVVLTVVLAAPAFGGPSLLTRVTRLERQVRGLRALAVLDKPEPVRTRIETAVDAYVTASDFGDATATCSSGHVTGGGGDFSPAYGQDHIVISRPENDSWHVVGFRGPDPQPGTLTAYVVCAGP
jgi:hypothetical protein